MTPQAGLKKFVVVLAGPTAVGKTDVAIQIAKHFKTEIISADSRQFYKELNIGTAVPDAIQLKSVKHHFIQHISVTKPYDVATYENQVLKTLDKLFETRQVVIITGGSGLYIDAICHGLDNIPETSEEVRFMITKIHETEGLEGLQIRLQKVDPQYYAIVDQKNPRRLQRALEVCYQTGKTFTFYRQRQTKLRDFEVIWTALQLDRIELINRINLRVEKMMTSGLFEEVKKLYPSSNLNALNTVGYKELFEYIEGLDTLDGAVEKIKVNTRHYAKRQMTWLRKNPSYTWFHPSELQSIIEFVNVKMKA